MHYVLNKNGSATVKINKKDEEKANQSKVNPLVTVGKTVGNIATNMGEGALRTGEALVDTANSLADRATNALSYLGIKGLYGKEKADQFKKESDKATSDFIKRDLTKEFQDKTGFSDIKEDWEKGSLVKSGNFGGQVAQGIGGMVPSLLAGQYLGFTPEMTSTKGLSGLSKAKAIGGNIAKTYASQLPANAILGASSYGSGMEEALREGANLNQASRYGLANAAIEQGTEMLTGGIPGLGGQGGIDNLVNPLIDRNTRGYANALLKAGYGALGEGLEESAGTYLGALAKKGILNKDIDWNEVNQEALQSGLVGAATGAVLNAPSTVQDIRNARVENQEIKAEKQRQQEIQNIDKLANARQRIENKQVQASTEQVQARPETNQNVAQQTVDNNQPANNLQTTVNEVQTENLAEEKAKEPVLKVETTGEKGKQYWKEQGASEEVAKVMSEMPKVEKKSIGEKIKEGKASLREEADYFKRNLVDKGETIYKISKKTKNPNLYAKYDKRGTTTGEANYDIGKAQTNLNGKSFKNFTDENGKKTSMSLNKIWEGVDNQAANEYLAHWLNIDRYNQVNEDGTGKYVFGTPDITPEISQQKIAELEKQHPELKRFGENVWQYGKNQLQNMVDSGKISQKQANQFLQDTPHYVRLQRNVEKSSSPLLEFDRKGNAKVNKNIKEFKGSNIDILPFKESMAQYTLDVRNSIRDNIFAQELAKTLGIGSEGEAISNIEDIMGVNNDLLRDNGNGTYSLTFFNKGVATTIPIDEGIYESLQPNKHYKFENKLLFKGIRKIDSARKALLTDKNPMFLATNMMKDVFDAPLNSKYPALFAKNYPRAVSEILNNGEYYQQYQALGGLQNTYFNKEGFQKEGSKYNPLTWVEKANNAIEQFPRLAEFISTMEKTGDIDQAMYNAAEITTNFKRGGDIAKAANRNGATFLNASIQGFDKQIRNFTDIQNPQQAVQLLGKIVALGIVPGLINDIMWDDDDEYKEMQDYQKDRYYLFKGKNGEWIRIPKGRAISVFQSAARRTKYALKGEKDTFKGFGKFASDQVAPNNPFENNIISPFVDVARNESWSGNPIVSESIKNETHPEEEYTIKTDEFSKWLGKKTGQSPAKINYLIDQYSGAIGDIVLPNITKKVSSKSDNVAENLLLNPIKDKFTTNAVTSNKSQNEFYEALSRAEDNKKWSKATEEDKAIYKYLYNKNLKISDLRKEMIEVQESNKSNKEKYKEVMDYTKEINRISKEAVNNSKNIEKPSDNEFVIGDKHYTVTDGQVNAIKDETVQKAKEYGLSVGDYADITSHYGSIKADKDENGNTISGSKKQKFIDYVQAKEELTEQQKIAIIQKYYKKYTGE